MNPFLRRILDAIEQREARLLVWCLVDGRLAEGELRALIDRLLDLELESGNTEFLDAGDVLAALRSHGLLFATDDTPYPGFRSRMAETVRLLFRLRQLFPRHAGPDGWREARTLVADYRFLWRQRSYPRRNVPIETATATIGGKVRDAGTRAALSALLADRGDGYALAEFQVRATIHILGRLEGQRSAGTLVSAGTGSGKTLAFYLPALARIATHVVRNAADLQWVKVLAIYPRTELLRDQFGEVYREARRLDRFLHDRQKRKILIATLFGGTPSNAHALTTREHRGWARRPGTGDFVCQLMTCPADSCEGELVWRAADMATGTETLHCGSCGHVVGQDKVILTRDRLKTVAPDILFTTTEMLNQRLSDSGMRGLFGLRPQAARPPEMMLLDEVHSYSDFHGAQVAYLLRRWMHLVRAPISFVGLSATLRDGARFFAQLTGLNEAAVEEVAPRRGDMMAEGGEYMLALRGDPVSRASLLSTTIQATMLLSRMLDPPTGRPSHGTYGSRVFVFTDDIDVINRLFFSLLDAEGRDSYGNPDMTRHPNGGLAVLRRPITSASRERNGQNWNAPEEIGHSLEDRKRIGRTSSQDPGVAVGADVVVATASLEVGFNDSTVGAVVQHKAPRDMAPFLQRKGRAGRLRGMRPWTVVILSDYGRDRLSYQGYDRLFDPELGVRSIPLSSRYVRRIQATYALIDHLARSGQGAAVQGSVWTALSGPGRGFARTILIARLRELLSSPGTVELLADHVGDALQLPAAEVGALLWEYPRPLMTAVIPTALRRLETNWRRCGEPESDFRLGNSPLPEFASGNLFSDLNLPEVSILLPPTRIGELPEPEAMPVAQAMRTFAPGRVSRRFGTAHSAIRHWVAPELSEASEQPIETEAFFGTSPLGEWSMREGDTVVVVPVFRPYEIRPANPPRQVRDTSNARMEWRTHIVAPVRGVRQSPPTGSRWLPLMEAMEAFTHGEHTAVEVRRFAVGSVADIQFERRDGIRVRFPFLHGGHPAGLGFSMTVDAVRFALRIPTDLRTCDGADARSKWRALRTARFFDLAWSGGDMPMVPNPFTRQWLATVFFAAVTYEAVRRAISLDDALAAIADGIAELPPTRVLDTLFQSPLSDDPDDGQGERDRLRVELAALLRDGEVMRSLHHMAEVLRSPVDADWEPWLRQRYMVTVGAAILEAIRSLCPDVDTDGLLVDIDPGPRCADALSEEDPDSEIWITETNPGGIGLVEEFLRSYAEDPRRFYTVLSAALRPNEHELIDHQLGRFLEALAGTDPIDELVDAVNAFRNAPDMDRSETAFATLRHLLPSHGFVPFHGFLAALGNRILRPGGSSDADGFLLDVIRLWHREEERLGVELDARTLAYHRSQDSRIDRVTASAGLPVPSDDRLSWRFNVISGLLWPRGAPIRRSGLGFYNPFAEPGDAERLLVSDCLGEGAGRIRIDRPDWREAALAALAAEGAVTIVSSFRNVAEIAGAVTFFATNPVQSDYLAVYARIEAVRRVGETYELDLELPEVL